MSSTFIFHAAKDLPVAQRVVDGYINATALCKASGKKINDYLRLDSTKEFLEALSGSLGLLPILNNPVAGIPATALVIVFKPGHSQQGAWVHPQVAIHLAMWCSPEFAVLVTGWVVQRMTGKPSQAPQHSPSIESSEDMEVRKRAAERSELDRVITLGTKEYRSIQSLKSLLSSGRFRWLTRGQL
jgi:hypothetical protein